VDIKTAPKTDIRAARTVNIRQGGETTWAEKVRNLIRANKPKGVGQPDVIQMAINNLGMTKERARSCVRAHWDKV
jgi:hypothetical protein